MQSFHRTTWVPKETSEQHLQVIIPFAAEREVMPSRGPESCRGRMQEEHQVCECPSETAAPLTAGHHRSQQQPESKARGNTAWS